MVNKAMPDWRIFMLLLFLLGSAPLHAELTAQVDRTQLSLNESLQLTIRSSGSLNADAPDTKALERDFEILERRRSSSLSFGIGQRESTTEWQFTLVPRRDGRLRIPPLTIDGESTAPIDISVSGDSPAATGDADIRLEVLTDTDELRVQQQLLLTVRVLHAVDLGRGASLEPPDIDDAVVSELGEHNYTKTIDGRRFAVYERKYAVFPQRSGELRIPPLAFRASIGRGGWFDQFGGRSVRLRSQEKRLRVLPPVDQASPWLPARVLSLVETWDKDPHSLQVGDSTTRTITLSAHGLTAAQLPPLPTTAVDGLRFYPDQPRLEDTPTDTGMNSSRVEATAVIPERAGTIVLPPIELRWWNTVDQRFETAVIPERKLEIKAAVAAPGDQTDAPSTPISAPQSSAATATGTTTGAVASGAAEASNPPLPWMLASLVLALGLLFVAWQWWRATQRLHATAAPAPIAHLEVPDEATAFAAFETACGNEGFDRICLALRNWGMRAFPDRRIDSASDVVAATHDPALDETFRQLLAKAYGSQRTPVDARVLLERIEAWRAARLRHDTAKPGLPPLYPTRGRN